MAGQSLVFRVDEAAFLEYLPRHVIPYAGSSYRQEGTFLLPGGAALLACDAFSAGRLAGGERFGFDRLRGKTRVCRDGVAELAEGFDLSGGGEPFGGYPYLATVYVSAPGDLGLLAEDMHGLLVGIKGALASASAPAPNLCLARMLTQGAPALYRVLNGARQPGASWDWRLPRGSSGRAASVASARPARIVCFVTFSTSRRKCGCSATSTIILGKQREEEPWRSSRSSRCSGR